MLSVFVFLCLPKIAFGYEDPFKNPNNRFGIHIIDEHDLEDASKLVNSSGGDWGYVTIVIQEPDRINDKWQKMFSKMSDLHLIPIVRIASKPQGEIWLKPNSLEIGSWVDFLNSLDWPIKNKYVIIGNEPNHAKEWGGQVNPQEYNQYYKEFAVRLKLSNSDFFVMPAGLDASAPNDKNYMSEDRFLSQFFATDPTVINYIDGLSSHSYPNPSFSGLETANGKGSVRTFEWELDYLKNLGITKILPVFITETGWTNNVWGVDSKMAYVFENVWTSPNIVAVTPFLLNYQGYPFDNFSWKAKDGTYLPQYEKIASLPKVKGKPVQNPLKTPQPETQEVKPLPKYELASVLFGISLKPWLVTASMIK